MGVWMRMVPWTPILQYLVLVSRTLGDGLGGMASLGRGPHSIPRSPSLSLPLCLLFVDHMSAHSSSAMSVCHCVPCNKQ